ncbi:MULTISPECIES: hypothetical protein [Lysinibacillus]|uniref:Orn/DAP/Arg decarboxylase 2 N-terminal domain-containing protein n=1 Tax=Lysinibacillus sphaericus TaxID=1421 RepID=A0A544ULK8_LYSSH|nr:hypothetical protein [Lysinibacillus sp. SDF0037]TQR34375.1 hypothetical protein C7Y47_10415 [Lysinibacillus sp. SDF0037]
MSIYPNISDFLLDNEPSIGSPAIIYDYNSIVSTVSKIRNDIKIIPNVELCFAIKANRNKIVLKLLSDLGLGADVASIHEFEIVEEIGMNPVYSTSPAYNEKFLEKLLERNILPDFNSFSQLKKYVEEYNLNEVGVRVKVPLKNIHPDITYGEQSRFGINIDSDEFIQFINNKKLKIKQLHFHLGELQNSSIIKEAMEYIYSLSYKFQDLEVINIGGGLTYLYSDEIEVKKSWEIVKEYVLQINRQLNREVKIVVEPGMLILAMSGYLYSKVQSSDLSINKRIITVDCSAWNLTYWAYPYLVHSYSDSMNTTEEEHVIFGNTCYEKDVFISSVRHKPLKINDGLLMNPVGAYVNSMARNMHGYHLPDEWILKDSTFIKAGN